MARKKLKWQVKGNMFGHDISVELPEKGPLLLGHGIEYDPITRLDSKLKDGYLFRSPKADPQELATIWSTMEQFTGAHNVWVEFETKEDDRIELTAFARIGDQAEATMFAYAHSSFEKWSDGKEKEDAKERRRKPAKLRIRKDGTVRVRATVTSLKD